MLTIKMGSYTQIPEQTLKSRRERFKAQEGFDVPFLSLKKVGARAKEGRWSVGDKTGPQPIAS